ncbi:hypothetical protein [Streptomyces phytohabitans]|uniref:hypothetical protein n=1 Tax=Streptomyces phytohabitans TaxID=1150371 RepID=UPI00345C1CB4
MSLTYSEVKNVDLTALSDAVNEWQKTSGKFHEVGTTFNTEVTKGLQDSNWQGEAATNAFMKFREIRHGIDSAGKEAASLHSLLSGGLKAFRTAKAALEEITEELAGHVHLSVNHNDGSVYLDPDKVEPDDFGSLQKAYRETFRSYRERTRQAVEDAGEADSTLAWALKNMSEYRFGFNTGAYSSLKNAKENRAMQAETKKISLKEISDAQMATELNSATPAAIQFLSLRPFISGADQALHGSPWQGLQTATGAAPSYVAGKSSSYVEKNWKGGPGAHGRHRKPSFLNKTGKLGTKIFGWPAGGVATVIDFAYTPKLDLEEKIAQSRVMTPGPLNSRIK